MTDPTGDALKASAAQVLDMIVDEIAIARFDCLSDLEAAERILFAVAGARPLDPATEGKLREALRFAASRSVMSADDEQRILAALSPPVEQAPQPVGCNCVWCRPDEAPPVESQAAEVPVAWLYTSKTAGDSIVDWRPIDQMALRRDDWKWEPLYRGRTAKESGNAD